MLLPPGTWYRSSASSVPPHAYPASPRDRSSHSNSLQREKRRNKERATNIDIKQGTAGRIEGVGDTLTFDIYPVPHRASPTGDIWTCTHKYMLTTEICRKHPQYVAINRYVNTNKGGLSQGVKTYQVHYERRLMTKTTTLETLHNCTLPIFQLQPRAYSFLSNVAISHEPKT